MLRLPVKRPLAVLAFFVASVVIGYVSFQRLPITLMPDIALPKLTVTTSYSGASAKDVERRVTSPLEDSLGTVSGVEKVVSHSYPDRSEVIVYFRKGRSMDYAGIDVREKLEKVEGQLPSDAGVPAIRKSGPTDEPLASLVLHGNSIENLSRYTEEIRRRVSRVPGVARVTPIGRPDRDIKITVQPDQLTAHNVTISQISQAISNANVSFKLGELKRRSKNYLIQGKGRFESLEDIENVSVVYRDGSPLFLKDLARLESVQSPDSVRVRYNDERAIAFQVYPKNAANVVEVTEQIDRELSHYEESYLSDGATLSLVNRQSDFIEEALAGVRSAVVLGSILAFLVVLFFLGNVRNSLIIFTAIPVSILVTFVLLYVSDLTLNLMTLGGLALGAGMLIDNSIVVLESIDRHVSNATNFRTAIPTGLEEVTGAIVASTLTTVAVFFPIVFMRNFAARMFQSLALVVAFSLFASLFVAIFFVPSLVTLYYRYRSEPDETDEINSPPFTFIMRIGNKVQELIDTVAARVNDGVDALSDWVRNYIERCWPSRRRISLLAMVTVFLFGYIFYWLLPVGLFPEVNSPNFVLTLQFPSGTALETTQESIETVEGIVRKQLNVDRVLVFGGRPTQEEQIRENIVRLQARLPLSTLGGQTVRQRLRQLRSRINEQLPVEARTSLAFGDLGGDLVQVPAPIEVQLLGGDYEQLDRLSNRLVEILSGRNELENVGSDFSLDQPEFALDMDRQSAARLGLTVQSITRQTRDALEGASATTFENNGRDMDVRVRLTKPDPVTLSYLRGLPLITQFQTSVTLDRVSDLKRTTTVPSIRHEEGERHVKISADIARGSPERVLETVRNLVEKIPLPQGLRVKFDSAQSELSKVNNEFMLSALFAAFLVYLTMAGQFNRFVPPLIVMFSVPMAFVGAFAFLLITGSGLSIVSSMGLIVLTGIIVNNAILIVDLILQYRELDYGQDKKIKEACLQASKVRVRPVLMTTLTTGLALVPLLFMGGEASSLQRPLALSVLGGLLIGTVLILVYIPLLYGSIAGNDRRNP